jgi:predicted small metal-binding protein
MKDIRFEKVISKSGKDVAEISKKYVEHIIVTHGNDPEAIENEIASITASIFTSLVGSALFADSSGNIERVNLVIGSVLFKAFMDGLEYGEKHTSSKEFKEYLSECKSKEIQKDLGL